MRSPKSFVVAVVLLFILAVVPAYGLSIGMIDTFEDGTTQGWTVAALGSPHPAPPMNVASGGPAGMNDNYLLLTALGGNGPASKLGVMNASQWAGDYLAAGLGSISMNVRNFSTSDLYLRLEFEDPTAGPPNNIAFSADPIFLPAGGGWTSITFPIAPAFLLAGLGTVDAALHNTTVLRLYHSLQDSFPNPVFPIASVTAQLGVDNIAAVPEPATLSLLGGGILAVLARRRRSV